MAHHDDFGAGCDHLIIAKRFRAQVLRVAMTVGDAHFGGTPTRGGALADHAFAAAQMAFGHGFGFHLGDDPCKQGAKGPGKPARPEKGRNRGQSGVERQAKGLAQGHLDTDPDDAKTQEHGRQPDGSRQIAQPEPGQHAKATCGCLKFSFRQIGFKRVEICVEVCQIGVDIEIQIRIGRIGHRECEPEMVLKVSRHNKASNCNEAFSRLAAGTSCSSRMKWLLRHDHTADESFRMVADEFKVCRDVLSLKCTEEDLHFPETTCQPSLFNNYEASEPAVLLSLTNADQGRLEPMIQCSGISAKSEGCDEGNVELCLEEGKFHLVQSQTIKNNGQTAHATISEIRNVAAKIARRKLDETSVPKVILHTRTPLEIVFEDVLDALAAQNLVSSEGKVSIEEFQLVSRQVQAQQQRNLH